MKAWTPISASTADWPARAGSPLRLLVARGIDRPRQPVLYVAGMHRNDAAELARRDHFAGLADHCVAGVVEGDQKFTLELFRQSDQRLGVGERRRQRLDADDVDPGLEEGGSDRRVQVIGRDDHHGLDAVGPSRLGARHLAIVGLGAFGGDTDLGRGCRGVVRIGRERTGDEDDLVVEPHGQAMDGADEGVAAAADHSYPQSLLRCSSFALFAPVSRCCQSIPM